MVVVNIHDKLNGWEADDVVEVADIVLEGDKIVSARVYARDFFQLSELDHESVLGSHLREHALAS